MHTHQGGLDARGLQLDADVFGLLALTERPQAHAVHRAAVDFALLQVGFQPQDRQLGALLLGFGLAAIGTGLHLVAQRIGARGR